MGRPFEDTQRKQPSTNQEEFSEEANPVNNLILNFKSQILLKNTFMLFKPPGL